MIALVACGQQGEPAELPAVAEEAQETEAEPDTEAGESVEPTALPTAAPSLVILADGQVTIGRPVLPLSFETSGSLLTLNVKPGDIVQAGDVIGVLDDEALRDNVRSAELRLQTAENNLTAAELTLEDLQTWEPDEKAVAIAEANIESAKINVENAELSDNAANSGLTSANININQAQRELNDAQEAYDNAFSEAREWETQYDEPICETFQGVQQCQNYTWAQRIKDEREGATNRLRAAKENLQIAQANYAVEAARTTGNSAVGAGAQLVSAEQELLRALEGPTDAQLGSAILDVEQRKLALETEQFALEQATTALEQAQLLAPWDGTILSVDATVGGVVGPGSPVVTMLDTNSFEFHTTNLSERDLAQISVGQTALLTLKSYPADVVTGEVIRVGLQSTGQVGDAAIFPVIIQLENDNPDIEIRAGMTGRVEILRDDE